MLKTSVVLVTCAGRDESETIARALVQGKLAACVNILPGVTSIFHWEGKIEKSEEFLLVVKSQEHCFQELCGVVKKNHSYACPEIIAMPVADGSKDYLNWVERSVRSQS